MWQNEWMKERAYEWHQSTGCGDEIVTKSFFYYKQHKMQMIKLFMKNQKYVKPIYIELIFIQ